MAYLQQESQQPGEGGQPETVANSAPPPGPVTNAHYGTRLWGLIRGNYAQHRMMGVIFIGVAAVAFVVLFMLKQHWAIFGFIGCVPAFGVITVGLNPGGCAVLTGIHGNYGGGGVDVGAGGGGG